MKKFRSFDGVIMHSWENLLAENMPLFIFISKSIVMQYTGVEDKNDLEIYEGDIVTTATRMWVIEKRNDSEFCGFLPVEVGLKSGYLSTFIRFDLLEVIGNIYENPEFLKGK